MRLYAFVSDVSKAVAMTESSACASFFSLGGGGLRPPEPQLRGTRVNPTRGPTGETGFPP